MLQKQKVALVTGGGSGIGAATSHRLAQDGMAVGVADINFENARKIAEEIRENKGNAIAIQVDVASGASQDEMFATLLKEYGRLDCVASNAGIFLNDAFLEMSWEQWNKLISINLDGSFLCGQKAAEILIKQGEGGYIAFTVSQGGFSESNAGFSYTVSKWGLRGIIRNLAVRLASYGIKVNGIAPGNIFTPMMDYIIDEFAKAANAPTEAILASMQTSPPLGRPQPPEEMAALYSYLFSGNADSMLGFTIIDNGALIPGS